MFMIYGKENCIYCRKAKDFALDKKLDYHYVDLGMNQDALSWIKEQGFRTVPQIFKDGEHIGGYDEFSKLF